VYSYGGKKLFQGGMLEGTPNGACKEFDDRGRLMAKKNYDGSKTLERQRALDARRPVPTSETPPSQRREDTQSAMDQGHDSLNKSRVRLGDSRKDIGASQGPKVKASFVDEFPVELQKSFVLAGNDGSRQMSSRQD
jgi:hypothetical protein